MYKIIPVLLALLWSCTAKEAEVQSQSPDGKIQILIKGKKPTPVDPFQTEVSVLSDGFSKDPVVLEIFAEKMDTQTVKIQWQDATHASILFQQQDGTQRTLYTGVEANRLFLHE